jgi:transposase InsO family protein
VGRAHCRREKGGFTPVTRTADAPGQTVNIDLCFVPASLATDAKLPAVSGSSGRLVVERLADADTEPAYPGQVFAEPQRDYTDAMQAFVAASQASEAACDRLTTALEPPAADQRQHARAVRQAQADLRMQRRHVREQRKQEDAAWRVLRAQQRQHRTRPQAPEAVACGHRRPTPDQQAHWRALRAQRRQQREERTREDAAWREARQAVREQAQGSALITAWIAILVITDNCTRQCLGLPLFVAGARVTADMVVTALRALLPDELQFLISDRGVHFTAQVFAQLAREEGFLHVVIARHRPQSNGIAERFVRTLKEWLADKVWTTDQELAALLAQFRAEYNDRPHQGVAIPGLSPNEFAARIWLM